MSGRVQEAVDATFLLLYPSKPALCHKALGRMHGKNASNLQKLACWRMTLMPNSPTVSQLLHNYAPEPHTLQAQISSPPLYAQHK